MLWDPWETASYRNNMLPFSIIIKLHLYEAEAPAALRTSQKVGATNVSLQMAQPQNQLFANLTGVFRNWPPHCCWFQHPKPNCCKSYRDAKKVLQDWHLRLKPYYTSIPLSAVLGHSCLTDKLQNVFWLRSKQTYLQFTMK